MVSNLWTNGPHCSELPLAIAPELVEGTVRCPSCLLLHLRDRETSAETLAQARRKFHSKSHLSFHVGPCSTRVAGGTASESTFSSRPGSLSPCDLHPVLALFPWKTSTDPNGNSQSCNFLESTQFQREVRDTEGTQVLIPEAGWEEVSPGGTPIFPEFSESLLSCLYHSLHCKDIISWGLRKSSKRGN